MQSFTPSLRACALAISLALPGLAHALTIQAYDAASLAKAQGGNGPVAVQFHADWCPTCKAQGKALESLKADPALSKATVLVANFDKESDLKKTMNIRAQSTIVVFKGKAEVAREGGTTNPEALKTLLLKGQ